jgi:puromycin-sensitive aminopeptidase
MIALLVLALTVPARAAGPDRLPASILPESYELKLGVNPSRDDFSGVVEIRAVVVEKTDSVVLHEADLTFRNVSVDGIAVPPEALHADPATQTLTIDAPKTLAPGKTVLRFEYSGKYNRQMAGLYMSTAKHDGHDERYAFTQFEATDARRMFPCFDEPAFKAVFRLTVTAPADLTVISNMPAAKTSKKGAFQTVSFEQTPKMSSYLLALAVARLASKSAYVGKTKVSVWARPEDLDQADFALEVATQALTRLNAYFDLPYQLPKMDLVAVPDFSAGAMENWGAIFFRDGAILFDPKLSSARGRRRVAGTVTHEIVHQWFGDLVTMKWWNDVWLNEAFATWLATKMVDQWHPEWLSWQSYEQGTLGALDVDSLRSTRPVSSKAVTPAEIDSQFDRLSYDKGGALLRMFENFLGEERFRTGLRNYVSKYRYQNTEAADLWRELEAASDRPMAKIAMDWVTLPGYPLIKVSPASNDNRSLEVSQSRFSAHGPSDDATLWSVPLVFEFRDEKGVHSFRYVLSEKEATVALPAEGRVSWVYPNAGQTGYYRVALDPSLLKPFDSVGAIELDPQERLGLLSDLWMQARSGQAPLSEFLDLLAALGSDSSRTTLESLANALYALNDHFVSPADKPLLARAASDVFAPHWKELGWDAAPGESDETRLSRGVVLLALGRLAAPPELLKENRARLELYFANPESADPALVYPMLSLAAKTGDAALFERYRAAMKAARTPEQRDNLLYALADFEDPALNESLLSLALTPEVRGQDVAKPYNGLLGNAAAQDRAEKFLEARWPEVSEKAGGFMGARRIVSGMSALRGADDRDGIVRLFAKPENHAENFRRELDQALEQIQLGVDFQKNQSPVLSDWLKNRASSAPVR